MDEMWIFLFWTSLLLIAVAVVCAAAAILLIWAPIHFGRLAYRQATRRHLYVPVDAQVKRVLYYSQYNCPTALIDVVYDYDGQIIKNRLESAAFVGIAAQQLLRVRLLLDPEHPGDVLVSPDFYKEAAAIPHPPHWNYLTATYPPVLQGLYWTIFVGVLVINLAVCLTWLPLMWSLVSLAVALVFSFIVMELPGKWFRVRYMVRDDQAKNDHGNPR